MQTQIYSARLFDELEPFYNINIDGNAISVDALRYFKYLEIIEEEGKKGILRFAYLNSFTEEEVETEHFIYGAKIGIFFGYRTHFEKRGPYYISKVEERIQNGGTVWIITAEEAHKLSRNATKRVFNAGTVAKVIANVLDRHGIPLVVEGDSDLNIPVSEENPIVQSGETDGEFINRLAADFGWTATIMNGAVHLTPPTIRKSLGEIQLDFGHADANVFNVVVKRKKPSVRYAQVEAPIRPQKKIIYRCIVRGSSPVEIKVCDENNVPLDQKKPEEAANLSVAPTASPNPFKLPDLPKTPEYVTWVSEKGGDLLKKVLPDEYTGLIDAATAPVDTAEQQKLMQRMLDISALGDYSMRDIELLISDEEKKKVSGDGGGSQEEPSTMAATGDEKKATHMVNGRRIYRAGKLEETTITLKFGHPMFRPQHQLNLRGVRVGIDGKYRIKRVVHRFDSSVGFRTQLISLPGWKKIEPKKAKTLPFCDEVDDITNKGKSKTGSEESGPNKATLDAAYKAMQRMIGITGTGDFKKFQLEIEKNAR